MVSLLPLTGGCVAAHADDAPRSQVASPTDAPAANAPFTPLYFATTNTLDLSRDVLAGLDLNAGAVVQLEAATSDASPIRFEIWRAHNDGHVELLNAFDDASGFVLTTFDSPSEGRTFLHFPAPASPRVAVVHLDCDRNGQSCARDLQPGDACLAGRACASGLTCVPTGGACSTAWTSGTCVLPSNGVECEDIVATGVVCGCDGHTYGSACLANAAGVGVLAQGECSPTPPPR